MAFNPNASYYDESYQKADLNINDKIQDIENIKSSRTTFSENGDYRVDNLMYPEDLLSANGFPKHNRSGNTEYGNNYVIFYINVNASSKLLTNDKGGDMTIPNYNPSDINTLAGKGISEKQVIAASAGISALAGGAAGKILSGDLAAATSAAVAGGVTAIGVGAIAETAGTFTRQMKRLRAAIAMHTPNQISTRYSASWTDEDTNMFQMALKGVDTLTKAASEYKTVNTIGDAKDSTMRAGSTIAKEAAPLLATAALSSAPGKDAISTITGLAVNPKKEQIFRGVDFRTFTFDYQFFPRRKEELQNVQNIIYMFKLHMHPEFKDKDNFLYLYPSEFDIVHYNGVDENLNLPRHTSCVLTEMVVNYAPQGQFTSFEEGAPTQINMTLTFKELSQLTKERIQEGY